MKQKNIQAKALKKKHKFKINDVVYIPWIHRPKYLSKKRFSENWDDLFMVVGYLESWPYLDNESTKRYIEEGYEYVLIYLDVDGTVDNTACLAYTKDLRKYYGYNHRYEVEVVMENFEEKIKGLIYIEKHVQRDIPKSWTDERPDYYG